MHKPIKTKIMNKMDFHQFFEYLWEDELLEIVVSTKYLEENDEFIKNYTLELYRLYEMGADLKPQYVKKMVEITFANLFSFNPGTENIKEIPDGNRNF